MSWAGSTTWCSYTEEQIRQIIAEAERGHSAAELAMRYQVPEFVIRGWQTRYSGKGDSAADAGATGGHPSSRLSDLETENARLRRILDELRRENGALRARLATRHA